MKQQQRLNKRNDRYIGMTTVDTFLVTTPKGFLIHFIIFKPYFIILHNTIFYTYLVIRLLLVNIRREAKLIIKNTLYNF